MALGRYRVQVDDQWIEVQVERRDGKVQATIGDKTWTVDLQRFTDTNLLSVLLDNRSLGLLVYEENRAYIVRHNTEQYTVRVKPAWANMGAGALGAGSSAEVTIESPLTGIVVDVRVAAGQEVEKGDALLVIEAMKMQNEIRAPRAGRIKSVRPRTGQKVRSKDALVVLA